LSTDKPLYQPGQVIHLRALAIDLATRHAVGEKPITYCERNCFSTEAMASGVPCTTTELVRWSMEMRG